MNTAFMQHSVSYDAIESLVRSEVETPTPEEWDIDPGLMGNVVGGVIAGLLQDQGVELEEDNQERLAIEAYIRTAVFVAMDRHTHFHTPQQTRICSDRVICYLREPQFNRFTPTHLPHEPGNAA